MLTDPRPRALVTGGAGFLGSHVCESLLVTGFHVVCLDNLATGNLRNIETLMAEPRFTLLLMDIAQGGPEASDFDLVLHLASPTSPFQYSAMPIDILRAGSRGTWHALETARRCDARFVLASTSKVYGQSAGEPVGETNLGLVPPTGNDRWVYDASRFAEALTSTYRRDHRVATGIVRIFDTYGPAMRADDDGVVSTFLQHALDGAPLTVQDDGAQTRSFCYVADTVDAILRMATSLHPGPINIGNPETISILDLADQIIKLTGSSSEIQYVERPPHDPVAHRPDISLATSQLGWMPRTSLAAGLARTAHSQMVARPESGRTIQVH